MTPAARLALLASAVLAAARGADVPAPPWAAFTDRYCANCHNPEDRKGHLDLTTLEFKPGDPDNLRRWLKVHDRVQAGEMPPAEKRQPPPAESAAFLSALASTVTAHEQAAAVADGRAARRRLNAYELENTFRDLFAAPWLQVRSRLPEDRERHLFNKSAESLDVSHVFVARLMKAADYAMRQAISTQLDRVPAATVRYYARQQSSWTAFAATISAASDKRRFPLLGWQPQPAVRTGKAPASVGEADPVARELEASATMMGAFAPGATYRFDQFRAPVAGRYRVRFSGYTIWVGGGPGEKAHLPDPDQIARGRRDEPIAVFTVGGLGNRKVATFDLTPEPAVHDIGDVWLVQGEQLTTDPSRFYRRRGGEPKNPLAEPDGMPAIAMRWMEVEGPLHDEPAAPTPGYALLFGDLPVRRAPVAPEPAPKKPAYTGRLARGAGVKDALDGVALEVVPRDAPRDAERLLRAFVARVYRRPPAEEDIALFLGVFADRTRAGLNFCDALLATYTAVLASPGFLYVDDGPPGPLDNHALATRLALFLTNSAPDAALRARAARGELRDPAVLRAETERLLDSPASRRFVDAFLDYWIDARRITATAPSATLYGDYDMDDELLDAALEETRRFFTEFLRRDRPTRHLIDCDYAFVNERLARHYAIPGVVGAALRETRLPAGSPRGGLMTQALVLKVTANGTTTSPVLRGKWIVERLFGWEIPPPPPVPAVEPDIRGAVTIRQQLDQHRADPSCAACHRIIDPPGFALESFDVMGGWRDRYRAIAERGKGEPGRTKEGYLLEFRYTLPVDAAGELPDGRAFRDIHEFKRLALALEPQVARNLARQLVVFATGAPVRFSDRPALDAILAQAAGRGHGHGLRTLIHGIVQSDLFRHK